jgi:hypothetical protein
MSGHWKKHEETLQYIAQGPHKSLQRGSKIRSSSMTLILIKFKVYLGDIDNTHCPMQEFRTDPNSKYYSHKFYGPGVTYEVCIDVAKDQIIWVNGPFPAACHDITIFRGGNKKEHKDLWKQNSLYFKIPDGKSLIGDSGYLGESTKVSTRLGGHSKQVKAYFAL